MFKNDFFRFFAYGFAAGALIIGGTVAHAHGHVAPPSALSRQGQA